MLRFGRGIWNCWRTARNIVQTSIIRSFWSLLSRRKRRQDDETSNASKNGRVHEILTRVPPPSILRPFRPIPFFHSVTITRLSLLLHTCSPSSPAFFSRCYNNSPTVPCPFVQYICLSGITSHNRDILIIIRRIRSIYTQISTEY